MVGMKKKMNSLRLLFFLSQFALLSGAMTGCTYVYTAKGAYYRVRSGDTLPKISARTGVNAQDLAEFNNIEDSSQLKAG